MIEKAYKMSPANAHVIEPIIKDDRLHYMHMVLMPGEPLHTHNTNSNVYMTVAKGTLSLSLEDGEFHEYPSGTVLTIPYDTKMDAQNHHDKDILELIVIKAPAPENMMK